MNKKGKIIIIIIVLLLMIGSFVLITCENNKQKKNDDTPVDVIKNDDDDKKENVEEPSSGTLYNHDRFYTVQNCINDVISYIADNNNIASINLIDADYAAKNNINSSNIISVLNVLTQYRTFKAKKITYKNLYNNVTTYYVTGKLIKDNFEAAQEIMDASYTVFFDQENMTYSVAFSEEFNSSVSSIISNDYNKYEIFNLTDQELAKYYFYDLRSKLISNEDISNIVNGNVKVDDMITASISSFAVSSKGNNYRIRITDSNGIEYAFKTSGILEYTVNIIR